MQEIMVYCFQSVRYKLEKRLGYFDLLGFDFMLDENLNVSFQVTTRIMAFLEQGGKKKGPLTCFVNIDIAH